MSGRDHLVALLAYGSLGYLIGTFTGPLLLEALLGAQPTPNRRRRR
jgi:hypothetical protein